MTPEPWATIIWAAKLNIACSIANMITTALLIYGTLLLRKGTKLNNETRRMLNAAAIAMETRRAETTGSVAKP